MNNTVATKTKSREPYLDVLKGVAMVGVILVHYYASPNPILTKIATVGARCPQLFFIVSAFLTWKVLDTQKGGGNYMTFYKKRFFRIGPIFWLALLVALLLPTVTIQQHSVGDILTHVFFFNGFVPEWTNNIMHVEWYITDLAILYLFCPLLRCCAYNLRSSLITLFVAILLSSSSLIVSNNLYESLITADSSWEMYFHTFFFLIQLPMWMLGVVIYYWINKCRDVSWGGGYCSFL